MLTKAQNEKNKDSFFKILPYFMYDDTTNKLIKRVYDQSSDLESIYDYVDKILELDKDRRKLICKQNSSSQKDDESYKYYQDVLASNARSSNINIIKSALNYEAYTSGTFVVDSQPRKLFKYLLKENIISKENIDKMNSLRKPATVYYYVSRNPIDMMLCSTLQNFKSCMSLYSEHSGAFYMSLGAMLADPNRFIVYNTKGTTASGVIHGHKFHGIHYISRAFAYLIKTKNNTFVYMDRNFPNPNNKFQPYEYKVFEDYFNSKDLALASINSDLMFKSFFSFRAPKYKFNKKALPYYDHIRVNILKKNRIELNSSYGNNGCLTNLSNSRGFDVVQGMDDILSLKGTCNICNTKIYFSDDFYYNSSDVTVCVKCKDTDKLTECCTCHNVILKDKCKRFNDENYCSNCYTQLKICEKCGDLVKSETALYNIYDSTYLCENCRDNIDYCFSCLNIFNVNTMKFKEIGTNKIYFCENCYDETI